MNPLAFGQGCVGNMFVDRDLNLGLRRLENYTLQQCQQEGFGGVRLLAPAHPKPHSKPKP